MTDDRDYAAELMARIAHLENHIESVAKDTHKIMVAYEAALPAVYRLGLVDAATACDKERDEARANFCPTQAAGAVWSANAIRALPTPTAAELMARINEGEKK